MGKTGLRVLGLRSLGMVPDSAWAPGDKGIDTGVPQEPFPKGKYSNGTHFVHLTLTGVAGDFRERQAEIPTPEDELIAQQQERCNQCHGCEQAEPIDPVKAAINLMRKIEVDPTPEMCHVVGAYIAEDMKRPVRMENGVARRYASRAMDGVIRHYFQSANGARKATLEFIFRLRIFVENELYEKNFTPKFSEKIGQSLFDRAEAEEKDDADILIKRIKALEISSNAKAQMIAKAQRERAANSNGGGSAHKLGEALFEGRWKILLRATV